MDLSVSVDKAGHTVDFRLSLTRHVAAAKAFFKKVIRYDGRTPHTITLDGYAASHRAVREMREDCLLRNCKSLEAIYVRRILERLR